MSGTELAPGVKLARSVQAEACTGGRVAIPVHFAALADATPLSAPVQALSFDFQSAESLLCKGTNATGINIGPWAYRHRQLSVTVTATGALDGFMVWWDLQLIDGITYSSAPGAQNWQDHWVQMLHVVPGRRLSVKAGDHLRVQAGHSELKLDVVLMEHVPADEEVPVEAQQDAPGAKRACPRTASNTGYKLEDEWLDEPCGCGWHLVCSPERLCALNNQARNDSLAAAVANLLHHHLLVPAAQAIALDVSDGSKAAINALVHGCGAMVSLEPRDMIRLLVEQAVRRADAEDRVHLVASILEWPFYCAALKAAESDGQPQSDGGDQQLIPAQAHCLLAEPYHAQMQSSPLLQALSLLGQKRCAVSSGALPPSAPCIPARAVVRAALYSLPDLAKCHGPVHMVQGLDHSAYDRRVANWSGHCYPYSLWMYRRRALSAPVTVATLQYGACQEDQEQVESGALVLLQATTPGNCDAVVLWVEYVAFNSDHHGSNNTFWDDEQMFRQHKRAQAGSTSAAMAGEQGSSDNNYDCSGWFTGQAKQLIRFLDAPFQVTCGDGSASVSVAVDMDVDMGTGTVRVLVG
eukprot:TRINITY_DN220_c0_g1_i5.p1 TRINITY_DN220_c0_g1~~TRINITY_DN220_c0_g1_i5.p1  ORF type:complete len:579 (-),score=121.49 TRINITY_DN220_c0_g1_i5:40-1776(-)